MAYAIALLPQAAEARSFIVYNISDSSKTYFIVNGTTGNVGIGTASPGKLLHVKSASDNQMLLDANSGGQYTSLYLANNGTQKSQLVWDDTGNRLLLTTINASAKLGLAGGNIGLPQVIIDSSGNVGIGTTDPGFKLRISNDYAKTDTSARYVQFLSSNEAIASNPFGLVIGITGAAAIGNRYVSLGTEDEGSAWGGNLVLQANAGNVGIGITNPSYKLQLSADSAAKPSTNTWTIASDARIKTDIRPFNDSLSVIDKINPVWYRYNGKGGFAADGKDYIGVIAQDIEKAAPYTVSTYRAKLNANDTNDTELLNFNSHALTFVLINAVKEQQKEIGQLKSDNDALKSIVCSDHPSAQFCR